MLTFIQQQKKSMMPFMKNVLVKHNVKGALSIKNHSRIVLTVRAGNINFLSSYIPLMGENKKLNYLDVRLHSDKQFTLSRFKPGKARDFISDCYDVLMKSNWDNSEPELDNFNVGWYASIMIGNEKKPYELKAS
ncbi:MAG: hypothetical protein V4525_07950 [Pseudomonadota bacterium]